MPDLLSIEKLEVEFSTPLGPVRAVNGVSYGVASGEIVAVVGESGSGKSVTALSVLQLVPQPPGRILGGRILFDGENILDMKEAVLQEIRGRHIAMIFQEPMTSLNPVITIGRQLTESMRTHLKLSRSQARERGVELLTTVGIGDPGGRMKQYPHHLSGGMRQRVMVAIALSCQPELILADEPTTALDVTIQAQILELMRDLCLRMKVALVIITHNLAVVARYANRVNVMYAGRIIESGNAQAVYGAPSHPYTLGLLASVPRPDRPRGASLDPIPGNPPDLAVLPSGCAFQPRCAFAKPHCTTAPPPLTEISTGHFAACFESGNLTRGGQP